MAHMGQFMISLDLLDALQAEDGQRLLEELRVLAPTAATAIAVATRLRSSYPAELVGAAMEMTELRGRARDKFSRADALWLTRGGLEQATSEAIARWRARRFREVPAVADLCCGIGGDLIALAAGADDRAVLAVDRDPVHLAMARANASVHDLGDRIAFREGNVREVDVSDRDGVFIDPARRTGSGRLSGGQSEPPLAWCVALADRVGNVGIKTAPGIPRDLVPDHWELETIALGTDLKEAVLWSPGMAQAPSSATVIREDGVHRLRPVSGDRVLVRAPDAGENLLDPNPAVTRAGLVEDLARLTDAAKLDDQLAFLVTATEVSSPFARTLPIVASMPWHEGRVRQRLRELDAGPVDVRRRGLAGDVDAIAKRLRGTGVRPFTLAMTRVREQPWALICEDPARRSEKR